MNRLKVWMVLAAAAVALAACGSGSASDSTQPKPAASSEDSSPAPATGAAVVAKELKFTSTTTDGKTFDGTSLAGRPAVVWFWAPWCQICMGEAPGVRSAAESSGVAFLGVAALDKADAMRGFVDKYKLEFPNLVDTNAEVWARFGVTSQPSYAFISADGSVDVVPGALSESKLEAKIAAIKQG